MTKLFRKYWIVIVFALIINIPIIVLGTVRTSKEIDLKGDTTRIDSYVKVDTDYEQEGSISSIYVTSVEKSTYLMNYFAGFSKTSSISEQSQYYKHLTDHEQYRMGQIQKNSSTQMSVINAYEKAKKLDDSINLDYSFKCFAVSYYFDGSLFRIDDEIYGINEVSASDGRTELVTALANSKENDIVYLKRNGKSMSITLKDNIYKDVRLYSYFNISYLTASPSITIGYTFTGGPSAGLLRALYIYNMLTPEDITHGKRICGTGTIGIDSSVGAIGGIKQKIYTAYEDGMEIFFCPEANYEEALEAYNSLKKKERMTLVKVSTFDEALEYLANV